MEKKRFAVENGAMTEVPVFEEHSRGKNWLAIIEISPTAPGGLERDFQPKAHGDYYYMVEDVEVGEAVEFGADYYSGRGRKTSNRWHGVVTAVGADFIEMMECDSGRDACKAAEDYQQEGPVELTEDELSLVETLRSLPKDRLEAILNAI